VLLAVLAGPAADWLSRGVSPGAASKRERAFARRYMERTDGSDDWSTAWRLIEEIHPLDPLAVARAIPDTEWAGATPEDLTARYGRPAIEAHQGRIAEELERIAREAVEFVTSKWVHVVAVAEALLSRGTLSGEEVEGIVEGVETRLAAGPSLRSQAVARAGATTAVTSDSPRAMR
jgi:hypothetical protein